MYVNNVPCVIVCSGDTDAETVKCRVARETGRDSEGGRGAMDRTGESGVIRTTGRVFEEVVSDALLKKQIKLYATHSVLILRLLKFFLRSRIKCLSRCALTQSKLLHDSLIEKLNLPGVYSAFQNR